MIITLRSFTFDDGTHLVETVDVADEEVAELLGALIPFARLFATAPNESPPKHFRALVARALVKAGAS